MGWGCCFFPLFFCLVKEKRAHKGRGETETIPFPRCFDTQQALTTPPHEKRNRTCRHVLTDSNFLKEARQDVGVVVFTDAWDEHVTVAPDFVTSNEGADRGSTYLPVACASCAVPLGRVYKTTPPALDTLRDCFSFSLGALRSYMLGSCGSADADSPEFRSAVYSPSPASLARENALLKGVVLDLHRRMEALEKAAAEADAGSGAGADAGAGAAPAGAKKRGSKKGSGRQAPGGGPTDGPKRARRR